MASDLESHSRPSGAWTWLLACLAALAACAPRPEGPAATAVAAPRPQIPRYEPASGEVARLVMRGVVQSGDVYLVSTSRDAAACSGTQAIGTGNLVQHPESTAIEAGRPVTISFLLLGAGNTQWCSAIRTFTPAARRSYLLTGLHLAGIPLPGGNMSNACLATVSDITDADAPKIEPSALNRNPDGGARCVALARSKPAAVKALAAVPGTPAASAPGAAVLREGATSSDLNGLMAP